METQLFCNIVNSIVNRINKYEKVELDDIIILTKSAIKMEYQFVETGLVKNQNDAIVWAMLNLDQKIKDKIKWTSKIIK